MKFWIETIKDYTFNERWRDLVEEIGVEEITIVSRNNKRIIEKYFESRDLGINVVNILANELEVEGNVYTGRVKVFVSGENLAELVEGKIYICGKDERKILGNCFGMNFDNKFNGLYLCEANRKRNSKPL